MMSEHKLPIIFLNPATVLGHGDHGLTPSNQFILLAMQKPSPVYFPGGHSYAGIDDIAKAHVEAGYKGRIGERYILGGDNISIRELFNIISNLTGGRKPYFPIGHSFVTIAGLGFEALARITNTPPLFTRRKAHKLINYYGYVSSQKAKGELNYETPAIEHLLQDCIKWFEQKQWLKLQH